MIGLNSMMMIRRKQPALAALALSSLHVWAWEPSIGFGSRYVNPSALNALSPENEVVFSPVGDAILCCTFSSPFLVAYRWSDAGFGARYSDPSSLPAARGFALRFHPRGNAVAMIHSAPGGEARLVAWRWDEALGFGARYSDPSTSTGGGVRKFEFSPNGDAIAIANSPSFGSQALLAYQWSDAGFGARYSDPSGLSPAAGVNLAFHPSGNAIAVTRARAGDRPFVSAIRWSSAGFGALFSPADSRPFEGALSCAFSPSGNYLLVGASVTPRLFMWQWGENGFGSRVTTAPLFNGTPTSFDFAYNSIAIGSQDFVGAPVCIDVWRWDNSSGFLSKFPNPTPIPGVSVGSVSFRK